MRPDHSKAAYVALIKLAELAQSRLRDMVADWNESEKRFVVRRDGDEPSVAILLRGHEAKIAQHSKRNGKKRARAHSEHAKVLARPVGPVTVGELVQRVLFMEDHGLGDFTVLFFVLMRTCLSFGEGVEAAKRTLRYASLLGYKVLERSETGLQDVKEHTIVESAVLREKLGFGGGTGSKPSRQAGSADTKGSYVAISGDSVCAKGDTSAYLVFESEDDRLCVVFDIVQLGRETRAIGVNLHKERVGPGTLHRPTWYDQGMLEECASADGKFMVAFEAWKEASGDVVSLVGQSNDFLLGSIVLMRKNLESIKQSTSQLHATTDTGNLDREAEAMQKGVVVAETAYNGFIDAIVDTNTKSKNAHGAVKSNHQAYTRDSKGVQKSEWASTVAEWDRLKAHLDNTKKAAGEMFRLIKNVLSLHEQNIPRIKANGELRSAQATLTNQIMKKKGSSAQREAKKMKDKSAKALAEMQENHESRLLGLLKTDLFSSVQTLLNKTQANVISYKKQVAIMSNEIREQAEIIREERSRTAGSLCTGGVLRVSVDNETARVHAAIQVSGELFLLVRDEQIENKGTNIDASDYVERAQRVVDEHTKKNRVSVPAKWNFKHKPRTAFGLSGPEFILIPRNLAYDTDQTCSLDKRLTLRYDGVYVNGACVRCDEPPSSKYTTETIAACNDVSGIKKLLRTCRHDATSAAREQDSCNRTDDGIGELACLAVMNVAAVGVLAYRHEILAGLSNVMTQLLIRAGASALGAG